MTGDKILKTQLAETYPVCLAARGVGKLVNDLGIGPNGTGTLPAKAPLVVKINDVGEVAIGDNDSVTDSDSTKAVVQFAREAWGPVDILLDNREFVFFTLCDELIGLDADLIHPPGARRAEDRSDRPVRIAKRPRRSEPAVGAQSAPSPSDAPF